MTRTNTARAALALLAAALWLACPAAARAQAARAASAEPVMWSDVEIEFEGARAFPAEQLKRLASERVAGWSKRADGTARDLSAEPFDPDRLDYLLRVDVVNFMRRSGYLRAKTGEVRRERVGGGLLVTVPVEEGELYRLGEVRIARARHFAAETLRAFLPLKRGDVADGHAIIRWAGEHLKELYADSGFIQYDYEVEPEFRLEPGAAEGVADLKVDINEGPQFRVRSITFVGSQLSTEETLRAALPLKEGEVFSARKFKESVERINSLGHFEDVDGDRDTEFRTDEGTGDLDLVFRVTERAARPR